MSDSAVVGTFPGRDNNPGNRPFGMNRYCDCNNICILGLGALSGDVPLYVRLSMCCKYMCAGLSANSQVMLPRTYEVQ